MPRAALAELARAASARRRRAFLLFLACTTLIATLALPTTAATAATTQPAACALTDDQFSASVDALTGWQSLRTHQQRHFPPCADEGVYAQTHSERVPRLLLERWNELPELDALAGEAPEFRAFVLRHINARSGLGELQTLMSYTTIRCPRRQAGLCRQIREAAGLALEKLR